MSDKTKKPRKVLRDTIQGFITKPSASRIVYLGAIQNGVPDIRVSNEVTMELRGYSKIFLENLIKQAAILSEHAKRKTINTSDIVEAARMMNRPIYPAEEEPELVKDMETLKKLAKKGAKKVSIKDITVTSKSGFSRFAREILQDYVSYGRDGRFSSGALINARIWIENLLIEISGKAARLAVEIGNRRTLMPKDIQQIVRSDSCLKY